MTKNGRRSKSDLLKESNLTYSDYASIDDGNRYELVGGKLELMSPGPSVTHQMFSFQLQKTIAKRCESDYIILFAPLDVILSSEEVRQPDLILIHRSRMEIIRDRGVEGAPDLVVEILSPSTMKRDKIDKLKSYATYKVPEYWIVEPKLGALEQYFLYKNRYELANIYQKDELVNSKNIPCISFTMSEITKNIPQLDN